MSEDSTFRLVLGIGLLVVQPVLFYHRIRSQATGEPLDRRQEGLFILATLRPLGLMYMFGMLAWLINPAWLAWSSVPLPTWLRWMGLALYAVGGGFVIWTVRSLGPNLTDTVVTRRAHTLVTHGPYRWVRHPFYGSVALLILAISLIAANWFLFLTGTLVMLLLYVRTATEEEKLVERFGENYSGYTRRTGRFLPRLR